MTCSPAPAPDSTTISESTALPVLTVSHLRISALSSLRSILSQHCALLGKHRVHRPRSEAPPTSISLTFVTAHELGHQWWGHQLIGADVEGSEHDVGEPGRIFCAAGNGAQIRARSHAPLSAPTNLTSICAAAPEKFATSRRLPWCRREPYVWYQKGGPDFVHACRLHRGRQDEPRPPQFPDAVSLFQRQQPGDAAPIKTILRASSKSLDDPYPILACWSTRSAHKLRRKLEYLVDDGFNRIVLYGQPGSPLPLLRRRPTANTRSRWKCSLAKCKPTERRRKLLCPSPITSR